MNKTMKLLLASAALAAVAACGGGGDDGEAITDALNLTDPQVRFVNASDTTPELTLYRGSAAQADTANSGFADSSDYFDVETGSAQWSTKDSATGLTTVSSSAAFDSSRGNRYTIVTVKDPGSASGASQVVIADPSSNLGTTARLRVLNAAVNTTALDVYIRRTTEQDITTVGANFVPVSFKGAAPVSGDRSTEIDLPAGSYQLIVTATGSKSTVFSEPITLTNNADFLIVLVPVEAVPITPNLVKAVVIKTNDPAATQIVNP